MADFDREATAEALRRLGHEVPWSTEPTMSTQPEAPAYEQALGSVASTRSSEPVPLPAREEPAPPPVSDKIRELEADIAAYQTPPAPMGPPAPPADLAPTPAVAPAEAAPRRARASAPAPAVTVTVQQPTAPAPAPAAEPALVGPGNDGIEDRPINLSDKTRTLQSISGAAPARAQELTEGRGQIIDAAADQSAGIEEVRRATAADALGRARDREDERKHNADVNRDDMRRELALLKEQIGDPPTDTVGIVMGLVSALAASQGKTGLAQAFNVLGDKMNDRMKRYRAGIEAGERNLDGLGKIASYDRLMSADEEQAEGLIAQGTAAEMLAAADFVGKQAKSAQERNAVDLAKLEIEKRAVDAEVARRQRAQAAAVRAEAYRRMQNARTEEEKDAIRRQYGAVGEAVSRDLSKTDAQTAEVGGKILGNELTGAKIQTELGKSQGETPEAAAAASPIRGWVPPAGANASIMKPLVEQTAMVTTVTSDLTRLAEIADEVKSRGSWSKLNPELRREADNILTRLTPEQTQASGAGSPTGTEYEMFKAIEANPVAFVQRGDAGSMLRRSIENINRNHGNRLTALNWTRADQVRGGRPAASASFVEVKDPQTGNVLRIPATTAAKYGLLPADDTASE